MAKILILMGLPGSGKTSFAKKYAEENDRTRHIHMEEEKEYGDNIDSVIKTYIGSRYTDVYIIDEDVLTNSEVIEIINKIKEETRSEFDYEIHYWKENKEFSLHNIKGVDNDEKMSIIENSSLENLNVELIKEKCEIDAIKVINHEIEEKPEWKIVCDKLDIEVDTSGDVYSKEWLLCGEWWNCNGLSGYEEPEKEPDFEDFNKLVEELYPDIPFRKYKRLFDECVRVTDNDYRDYYSAGTKRQYCFNIEKLIEEINYIR